MDQMSVKLPTALYKRHQRLRKKNDLSISAQLRQASKEYLARNEALERRVDSVLRKDK